MEKGILQQSNIFFHTASAFSKQALYYPSNSGRYKINHLYETKRDSYEQYLFFIVKSGKMKVRYEDYEAVAYKGDFVFLNCYQPHMYKALENTTFHWLHFRGNASKFYFDYLFHKNGCIYPTGGNWKVINLLEEILDMMRDNKVNEHLASIYIHEIMYELDKISTEQFDSTLEETVRRAVVFIENHYFENITLKDIADHVKLSSFYFSRLFRKQLNTSPHQYLINCRVNNAKKLLHNSDLSVSEIAYTCGFNSVSHFVTTFKKQTEFTPKKYKDFFKKS